MIPEGLQGLPGRNMILKRMNHCFFPATIAWFAKIIELKICPPSWKDAQRCIDSAVIGGRWWQRKTKDEDKGPTICIEVQWPGHVFVADLFLAERARTFHISKEKWPCCVDGMQRLPCQSHNRLLLVLLISATSVLRFFFFDIMTTFGRLVSLSGRRLLSQANLGNASSFSTSAAVSNVPYQSGDKGWNLKEDELCIPEVWTCCCCCYCCCWYCCCCYCCYCLWS